MASYIDQIMAAGARTIPLFYDGDLDKTLKLLDHLNGVFYCGGEVNSDYEKFGKKIFDKIKKMNEDGIYMPVWGTCLGFEYLAGYSSGEGYNLMT